METGFTDKDLFIQNGNFGLYLHQAEEDYQVYIIDNNGTQSSFAYPIEPDFHLTYDGDISPLLQLILRPINSMEEVQACYNFATERITLKVVVGIVVLLFLASHGCKIRTLVGAIDKDLLRSQFSRRVVVKWGLGSGKMGYSLIRA